jgi:multicomponent K+:H+ antiporter subunit D
VNHLLVGPILIPLVGAILIPLLAWGRLNRQRAISLLATASTLGCAVALISVAGSGEVFAYEMGGWESPFGITLVLDRLSAMMVLLAAVVAALALLYAIQGQDERGKHFHFLFQMQVLGINGAFLTGDLFNLFVFFEVLLLASYALLLHGRSREQLRAGVHYVILNLVGSGLFIIAVGMMYGLTGTLNMADMALRVAELGAQDQALIQAAALLLLVVFSLKAAMVPLYMWLPKIYSAASAPVAALFAILTKVGVYAILRVSTLIFGSQAGVAANVAEPFVLPIALTTLVLGALGVLSSKRLGRTIAYLIVASLGTMLAAIGLYSVEAIGAGLYYLMHSTIITVALFLLAGVLASQRGETEDRLVAGPALSQPSLLGVLFFVSAIAVAGLPPLSGFLGKALILDAAADQAGGFWVWGVVISTSLIAVVALAQAGIAIFWRVDPAEEPAPEEADASKAVGRLVPIAAAIALVAAMSVLAGPLADMTFAVAEQVMTPQNYIEGVFPNR